MNVSRNVVRGRTFWPDRPALIFEGRASSTVAATSPSTRLQAASSSSRNCPRARPERSWNGCCANRRRSSQLRAP